METKTVTVRLPADVVERIKEISQDTGKRLERVWREAAERYVKAHDRGKNGSR